MKSRTTAKSMKHEKLPEEKLLALGLAITFIHGKLQRRDNCMDASHAPLHSRMEKMSNEENSTGEKTQVHAGRKLCDKKSK